MGLHRTRRLPRHWGMDLRPVRLTLAAGLGFSVLRAVLQWIAPLPLKLVFDSVLANHPLPGFLSWLPTNKDHRLLSLCAGMMLIAAVLSVSSYGANALLANAGQRVVFELRCRLFRHIVTQSQRFHQRQAVGDLLSRLGGDVQAMQGVVINVVPVVVENSITVAGMVVIMLVLDWRFSLLAVALLPLLWWVVRHYLAAIKAAQRTARRSEGQAIATAQNTLTSVTVVQAFGAEGAEADRYAGLAQRSLSASGRSVVLQARFTPLVTAVMTTATALVVFFGAEQVLARRLTPGDLLVFTSYFRGMYSPARQLAKLAGTLGRGQASAERVAEILAAEEHLPQVRGARRLRRVRGGLLFDDVSFSHPDLPEAISHASLSIQPGETHALVGATGSDKSTLLRLVPRFADPQQGRILLDGVDLRALDLAWLRSHIALVPQEMALLRPTVWENICFGSPLATRARAIAAARQVGVHEVLSALRDGYDTEVGEGGSGLSGGQRQCVAIARAMVRNAPIILLDEPTTGLDATTESTVLEALRRLTEGRTTLLVSHQLAAVHDADRITVLAGGRVVEQGSHLELLGAGRAYSALHRSFGAARNGATPLPNPNRRTAGMRRR